MAANATGLEKSEQIGPRGAQKVSNLILNINVYMEDARAGKLQFVKSVDIRGNSDETWRRGLDYLLRHYLFGEP
jgi:Protein of unknown function (DUF2380)